MIFNSSFNAGAGKDAVTTKNGATIEIPELFGNGPHVIEVTEDLVGPDFDASAGSISYDGTTSKLTATNVQDAIDALAVREDNRPSSASNISYDNTTTDLQFTATDVQGAIDEVANFAADLSTDIEGKYAKITGNAKEVIVIGDDGNPIAKTLADAGISAYPHTHGASKITTGTLGGQVMAYDNTNYTRSQLRNIGFGTGEPTSSNAGNGRLYFKYNTAAEAGKQIERVDAYIGGKWYTGKLGGAGTSSGGVGNSVEGVTQPVPDSSTGVIKTQVGQVGAEIFNSYTTDNKAVATGQYSHAENRGIAVGNYSHAEGGGDARGDYSHAEGHATQALGTSSHAEGEGTIASYCAHSEGYRTQATSNYSHAEGYYTEATGNSSHAEGSDTNATSNSSHAEGYSTTASGEKSHAEGNQTIASGAGSHAEGYNVNASGDYSHAQGFSTRAANFSSCAQGHYNKTMTKGGNRGNTIGDAMAIGNGTSNTTHSNCFRVTYTGAVYGLSDFNSSGADYAEYFEWWDGNANEEDRVGYFVTMAGDKIRKAKPGDYILGIVSGQPCIIGNADEDWLGRWQHDEFGRFVKEYLEEYEIEVDDPANMSQQKKEELIGDNEVIERDGKFYIKEEKIVDYETPSWRFKANPEYDSTQQYIGRKDRAEWSAVGMVGVLTVRDDGTCKPNGYCTVAKGGIATSAENEYSIVDGKIIKAYRVIGRVNESIIKVIFR